MVKVVCGGRNGRMELGGRRCCFCVVCVVIVVYVLLCVVVVIARSMARLVECCRELEGVGREHGVG